MDNLILSPKNSQILERLIAVATLLDRIYKHLESLELSNKKNTDEYNTAFEYLKLILEVEAGYYKKLRDDLNALKKILIYVSEKKPNQKMSIDNVLDGESLVVNRISNKLFCCNYEVTKEFIYRDVKDIRISNNEYERSIFLSDSVKIEKYRVFLAILFSYKKELTNFKRMSLSVKYNLSFLEPLVESDMITNNFEILTELFLFSKMTSQLVNSKANEYDHFMCKLSYNFIIESIKKILESADIDYNDFNVYVTNVIRQVEIRTYLRVLDYGVMSKVKASLEKAIIELVNRQENSKIGIDIIMGAFNKSEDDREIGEEILLKR